MAKQEESGAWGPIETRWRWRPEHNPYLHNIFAILGALLAFDDPDAPSARYDNQVIRLDAMLKFGKAAEVHGYVPTAADVAIAQDLAVNPNLLSAERLLAHKAHVLDIKIFDELARALREMELGAAEAALPLPLADVAPLARRLPPAGEISASLVARPDTAVLLPLLKPDPREERVLLR